MPKCKNDPTRSFKGTEPSPKGLGWCAHGMKVGVVKKGKDGNKWVIKQVKNGSKRWMKIKKEDIKIKKIKKNKKKDIILSGSYSGVTKYKKMKNFDIIKSEIKLNKNISCKKNKLIINKDNNKIYIYHDFNSIINNFSGRWYNTDLKKYSKYKLDDKKYILTYIIPEWELHNSNLKIIKNVPIKIHFTQNGWGKLKTILDIIQNKKNTNKLTKEQNKILDKLKSKELKKKLKDISVKVFVYKNKKINGFWIQDMPWNYVRQKLGDKYLNEKFIIIVIKMNDSKNICLDDKGIYIQHNNITHNTKKELQQIMKKEFKNKYKWNGKQTHAIFIKL